MPITKSQQKKLNALGLRIKTLRQEKGLTLEQLGMKINKENQSINRLENGKVNPGYLYLLEICKGLDIDLSELLNEISE